MRVVCLALVLVGGAGAVALAAPAADPARPGQPSQATVAVTFLADGRCTVSSTGEGFRSKVTYTPPSKPRGGELRCAFPPVQKGVTVGLTVTLPPGASTPGETRPHLVWTKQGDAWTGTATLTAWPEAIVVTPVDRPWLFWLTAALALGMLAMATRRWMGRRQRPHDRRAPAVA